MKVRCLEMAQRVLGGWREWDFETDGCGGIGIVGLFPRDMIIARED